MNFCTTEVNPLRDMAPWSLSSTAKSYASPDIFNELDNFVDNYLTTPIHPSIMPRISLKSTNNGDFRYNSGDYAVSSTVNIQAKDDDTTNIGTVYVPESVSLVESLGGRMNGHDFLQNLEPSPMNPPKSSTAQFPQPAQFPQSAQQFSQPFSQCSQIQSNCFPCGDQISCKNQFQPNQPKYLHYSASANYFDTMTPYQATNEQEIGWPMGQMRPPMASRPPVMSVSPYPTTSSPAQISSTGGSLVVKRTNARAKDNKWLPVKKYDNGIYHHCPICDRPFKNRSNIKTHLRTHTKEKPYVCQICQKAFCQKAHLTKHTVIHQRDRVLGK